MRTFGQNKAAFGTDTASNKGNSAATKSPSVESSADGVSHLEIDVPPSQYHRIIGNRGATIKSIQGSSRAKVVIPRSGDAVQNVLLVGTQAQIDNAQWQIEKILAQADANYLFYH